MFVTSFGLSRSLLEYELKLHGKGKKNATTSVGKGHSNGHSNGHDSASEGNENQQHAGHQKRAVDESSTMEKSENSGQNLNVQFEELHQQHRQQQRQRG
jgi:hypothetical protein